MPSQILTVTLQAALFSALSTVLAQSITAYQNYSHSQSLLHSSSSSNLTSPINPRSPPPPTTTPSLLQSFNLSTLLTFMAIAIIMTPPNYLFQRYLEDRFPSKVAAKAVGTGKAKAEKVREGERLSKSHTLAKLCLDQSLGAMANTAGFIILAGLAKGRGVHGVFGDGGDLRRDFLPMLLASWRVWPTVTLLNLCVVPFDYRMVVGNLVGVCWGVYVTLQTM